MITAVFIIYSLEDKRKIAADTMKNAVFIEPTAAD
jgi:hypothetical protein